MQDRVGGAEEEEEVGKKGGAGGRRSLCSYLALAVPRSISSLSHQTGLERRGPAEVRSRSELTGGEVEVEVEGGKGEWAGFKGCEVTERWR